MGEQLQGRALDEAVACAMGWTDVREASPETAALIGGGLIGRHPDPDIGLCSLPSWSDHAHTLPEMLAWLQANGQQSISTWWDPEHGYNVECCVMRARPFIGLSFGCTEAEGATLNEALCRLVLAVALAETKHPAAKEET